MTSTEKNAKERIVKRVREFGKQQVISEIGCVAEQKKRFGPNTRRMNCIFDTAGLGLVETDASQIDIDGEVELEVYDAREGFVENSSEAKGSELSDLKGEERSHDGFRFTKSMIDPRGIEYKDKIGNKWQVPLIKQNDKYNTKLVFRAPKGNDLWCRVSAGLGGSYIGAGQKVKCDVRPHRDENSILDQL